MQRRLPGLTALALIAGLSSALPAAAEQKSVAAIPPVAIDIKAEPVPSFDHRDRSRRRFGMLDYRGGLVLTSPHRQFGGFSGLRLAPDGEGLLALNDRGWWLRGRLTYDGQRPSGIADAQMAQLLASDGRPIGSRRWYDTEAMAQDGGTVYVALERVHRILRYDYGRQGLLARGQLIDVPPEMRKLPPNGGIEALAFLPRGKPLGGTLLAISETGVGGKGDHLSFMIGGPRPGSFHIRRRNDFSITDAALMPDGDLLILERSFGWTTGLFVRLRRISLATLAPGAVLDGAVLFEADLGHQIDNMEGLALHQSADGLVVTMISDDNFSLLQRTMLLQFTLSEK